MNEHSYNEYLLFDPFPILSNKPDTSDIFSEEALHVPTTNKLANYINYLYDAVIHDFHQNKLGLYNPKIFARLTRERFFQWVLDSNPEVRTQFGQ